MVNKSFYNNLVNELTNKVVRLVAVSKTKSVEEIKELYDLGQRIFGENKVQEILAKKPLLPDDIEWHLIGTLQTNKVKQMSPFRKETGLRDAMANLLEFYQLVLIKDYRTIFEIKKSALAEEEKNAKIKSILDQIRKKEAVLIESFREQEVSFAREYDIQLVSSGI